MCSAQEQLQAAQAQAAQLGVQLQQSESQRAALVWQVQHMRRELEAVQAHCAALVAEFAASARSSAEPYAFAVRADCSDY